MQICFFDLSESQELAHLNGRVLKFDEIYDQHKSCRKTWPDLMLSKDQFCAMEFHPYGANQGGWDSWISYFSTAIQLISGHTPSKEELKIVREYIRRMPNDFKKQRVDKRFVLGFISYLMVGFKSHIFSTFISESNAVGALQEFTYSLCATRKTLFTSFLCAHRDPKIGEALNLLQSYIPPEKVRRSASLVLALASNATEHSFGTAVFLQQSASSFATSSVFPEVSVTYFEGGLAYEMLDRIRYQYQLVTDVLKNFSSERVSAKLVTLDVLTYRIERFLQNRFGLDWRTKDFSSYEYKDDPIVELALDMALPGIKRMMPFFSDNFQESFIKRKTEILELNYSSALKAGNPQLAALASQTIEWFMLQHSMTISAKALYEITFYYLWGKYCGKYAGAFAIGLDREHDRYQHFAWKKGAESEIQEGVVSQSMPLYARRNPSGHEHGALSDLSFRQFWR